MYPLSPPRPFFVTHRNPCRCPVRDLQRASSRSGSARLHQHRRLVHGVSVRDGRRRAVWPRQIQDAEDRADRERRRHQALLQRHRRRAPGHRELVAAPHGFRDAGLQSKRRDRDRGGQDRLRRHRARQREVGRAVAFDVARHLPRAREERSESLQRRGLGAQSVSALVRRESGPAGRRHRGARSASDIRNPRRVPRARDGRRLQDLPRARGAQGRRLPRRLPHDSRRQPLHRGRRERQPDRAEARVQSARARHLWLRVHPVLPAGAREGRDRTVDTKR